MIFDLDKGGWVWAVMLGLFVLVVLALGNH